MTSFYSEEELQKIGFAKIGTHVLISRKASIYSPEMISIGDNVRIDDFVILSGGRGIALGSHIHISAYCCLMGGGGVSVGDFVAISLRVFIASESDIVTGHKMVSPVIPRKFKRMRASRVVLERHSAIAANSIVLPGAKLGEGTVVLPNSVVMSECKPWHMYKGDPVECIKPRSKKLLEYEEQFLQEWAGRGGGDDNA